MYKSWQKFKQNCEVFYAEYSVLLMFLLWHLKCSGRFLHMQKGEKWAFLHLELNKYTELKKKSVK